MNCWMLTITGRRKYYGNNSYKDDPHTLYKFDSFVPNHKSISVYDFVVVREGNEITGASIIEDIEAKVGSKMLNLCPDCNSRVIRFRKLLEPKYHCENGHEFNDPFESQKLVTKYAAIYGKRYRRLEKPIPWQVLYPHFSSNATQSIRKVSLTTLTASRDEEVSELQKLLQSLTKFREDGDQLSLEIGGPEEIFSKIHENYAPNDHNSEAIFSSNWTGRTDSAELAACVLTLGPEVLNSLHDWIYHLEHERNDPDPPEGMPDELLEQLKRLHGALDQLIATAEECPENITLGQLENIWNLTQKYLRPVVADGRLIVSGIGKYGTHMVGGFGTLKMIELITGAQIAFASGTGATYFAAGVAAVASATVAKSK